MPTDPVDRPSAPLLAVRLVTTYDDATRRLDLGVGPRESVLVDADDPRGPTTTFATERLWSVVRDLLPPLDLLRATPAGTAWPPPTEPPATFATDARAFVAVTTVTGDQVVLRSWFATDDTLWSLEVEPATPPGSVTRLLPAAPGALADLFVWDVTAALERLAREADERRAS